MINLFGTAIDSPKVQSGQFLDGLLLSVAKKDSERQVLRDFVTPRIGEIVDLAATEASTIGNPAEYRQQAQSFYLSHLKSSGAYEQMALKVISSDPAFKSSKTATQILSGKKVSLPPTFPGDHKKAEILVMGSLSSAIGDSECHEYLIRYKFKEKVQKIAKDMFYAVNNGLDKEQSIRYMSVLFDLEKRQTAETQNLPSFRKIICQSILTSEPVKLIHIKCLRFIYPKTGGVKILTDVSDSEVEGVLGKYKPKSEARLFDRILEVDNIFRKYGISTGRDVIVSDEDIDILFPDNHPFVTPKHRTIAKYDCAKYIDFLKKTHGFQFNFYTINELTAPIRHEYEEVRQTVIKDLRAGGSQYMPHDFYEHDRVDHQLHYYQQLFGDGYTRKEARRSISEQIASVIALKLVLKTFGNNLLIVEENREGENRLIAGGVYPVYFTRLRDPAVFGYKVKKLNYHDRSHKELRS